MTGILVWHLLKASAARAVRGGLRLDALGLISTHGGVGHAVVRLVVCGGRRGQHPPPHSSPHIPPRHPPSYPRTVGAGLLIRAISAVIKEVAAEVGADALFVLTQELVLVLAAALGLGRGGLCGSTGSSCDALRPWAPGPTGATG